MLFSLAAGIGLDEKDKINLKYVAKIMADDWGFYYTSIMNLNKIQAAIHGVPVLSDTDRLLIDENKETIINSIEKSQNPANGKSGQKLELAKFGTRKFPVLNRKDKYE